MAIASNTIAKLALELETAEVSRVQRRQISLDHPEVTIDDAYAIQAAWMALKAKQGRRVIGYKIGLTSKAMQRSSNIGEITSGAPNLPRRHLGDVAPPMVVRRREVGPR